MKELKILILGLAEIFGVELTEIRLRLYAEILGDLPIADVNAAIKCILADPSVKFFPLPAVIRQRAEEKTTIADATQELLSRALTAVVRFGYPDPAGARAYVGPHVWEALPGASGWDEFCRAGDDGGGVTTARAQLRERIATSLRRAYPTGQLTLSPPENNSGHAIEAAPATTQRLERLGSLIQRIGRGGT